MTHKHEKVTTYIKMLDGSIKITSKSYYEELAHMIEEIEKPYHNLDFDTMKEAVDNALLRISQEDAPHLVLTIKKQNGKIKLLEKYTISRKDYIK